MKYLIMILLFVGCASKKVKVIPKAPVAQKPKKIIKIGRHDKLLNCVDKYLDKDVRIAEAFTVCKGIYERK